LIDEQDSSDEQRAAAEQPFSQRPNEPAPEFVASRDKTVQPSNAATPRNDKQENSSEEFKRFEIWQLVINGFAVIVGTAVCFIYGCQLSVMNRQLDEMKGSGVQAKQLIEQATAQANSAKAQSEQAKAQTDKMGESLAKTEKLVGATSGLAKEAKRSADLSFESLRMAQENSRIDERPWLGVITISTEGGVETADSFSFKQIILTLQNSGKTPALKLSTDCCHMSLRKSSDPAPDYDDAISQGGHVTPAHKGGVVAPNSTVILSLGVPSMSIAKRASGEPMTYYITGKFIYYDTFPGSKQHTSKFCLMYRHGNALTFCQDNNSMD